LTERIDHAIRWENRGAGSVGILPDFLSANWKRSDGMIRKAFVMQVNPECHEEYERRHNPIWPELERELQSHGVHNYSIFLDAQTNLLFAYAEIESEAKWKAIAQTAACKKWWAYMRDVMPSNPDNSPKSRELREVFHLAERSRSGAARKSSSCG
jgi:L-rhamnose mutarotase